MTPSSKMPQDDLREIKMREILRLRESGLGRSGHSDAVDENDNKYELKTSFKRGKNISTARAVNHNHIIRWRTQHWVVAFGVNYHDRFELTEFYHLSPENMKEWIDSIEDKLNESKRIGDRVIEILMKNSVDVVMMKKVKYLLGVGSQLNDPNIPFKYIKHHGTLLTLPYHESLRQSVNNYSPKKQQPTLSILDYFI